MKTRKQLSDQLDKLRNDLLQAIIELCSKIKEPTVYCYETGGSIELVNRETGEEQQANIGWISIPQKKGDDPYDEPFIEPEYNLFYSRPISEIMDIHDLMLIHSILEGEIEDEDPEINEL